MFHRLIYFVGDMLVKYGVMHENLLTRFNPRSFWADVSFTLDLSNRGNG